MEYSEKIILSIIFLLSIPLFRIAFNIMLKRGEIFFKRNNPKRMSFFYGYKRIVLFIVTYIWPAMIIITIALTWIKN